MPLPDLPAPPIQVPVTNLYDVIHAQNGSLDARQVRDVMFVGAKIDRRVLWLEIPTQFLDLLGLGTNSEETNQLSPVRIAIGDRTCTVHPSRGSGDSLVIGHATLTSLGLKVNKDGHLIEDSSQPS